MRRSLYLFVLLPLLVGCGGHSGGVHATSGDVDAGDPAYSINPIKEIDGENFGETVTATASVPVDDITFSVEGGNRDGILSYTQHAYSGWANDTAPPALGFDAATGISRVTYVSPSQLGTFRIIATFLKGGKVVATRTAVVNVISGFGYGV